jgi:hypothetical protein
MRLENVLIGPGFPGSLSRVCDSWRLLDAELSQCVPLLVIRPDCPMNRLGYPPDGLRDVPCGRCRPARNSTIGPATALSPGMT